MTEYAPFPKSTEMRSAILRAMDGSPADLEKICGKYRAPVRSFLRARGFEDADAEDLTQEVFQRILEGRLLKKFDPARGRFRSMILGITKNVVREARRGKRAAKRGGGRAVQSLDETRFESKGISLIDLLGGEARDEEFDRIWVMSLLEGALERLKTEAGQNGELYYRALKMRALESAEYKEIAAALGRTASDVRNFLHRAKTMAKEFLSDAVREYSSSKSEYDTEILYLSKLLPKEGGD